MKPHDTIRIYSKAVIRGICLVQVVTLPGAWIGYFVGSTIGEANAGIAGGLIGGVAGASVMVFSMCLVLLTYSSPDTEQRRTADVQQGRSVP